VNDRSTSLCEAPHVQDDAALLDLYVRTRSPEAFTAIVQRHIGWVSALARRKVKDRHLAEDVTQAVFMVLARKAASISRDAPLSAWLFRVARFAANDAVKQESRRRVRMNKVAEARATESARKRTPELDLDEAIACLSDSDRQAIFLRFYEDKSMAEVGQALGINEVAAKKRVSRALRRLREIMTRRGAMTMSIAMLALLLLRGTRAATAASGEIVVTIARSAAGIGEPSTGSVALADATIRRLAGAQSRLLAALAGSALVLVLAVSNISVMGQIFSPIIDAAKSIFVSPNPSDPKPAIAPAPLEPEKPPPVMRIWAGRSGDFGWPIFPGSSTWPIRINSPAEPGSPVVIVEDSRGRVWYRPVDHDLVPANIARPAHEDYDDLNPYASATQRAIEELINRDSGQFRQAIDSDGAWQRIDGIGADGSILLPEFNVEYFAEGEPFNQIQIEPYIPEPAGLVVCGAIGIYVLRGRRRA
jgi:RNA polymerase sigma factor (sigma-70 family)